mmetsp:Transcript_94500/g.273186  ORF Transcript_94500/g.273186 Transcript_94500/m.273186 type:complete len:260 (+) Transcript_94500:117-896(+)
MRALTSSCWAKMNSRAWRRAAYSFCKDFASNNPGGSIGMSAAALGTYQASLRTSRTVMAACPRGRSSLPKVFSYTRKCKYSASSSNTPRSPVLRRVPHMGASASWTAGVAACHATCLLYQSAPPCQASSLKGSASNKATATYTARLKRVSRGGRPVTLMTWVLIDTRPGSAASPSGSVGGRPSNWAIVAGWASRTFATSRSIASRILEFSRSAICKPSKFSMSNSSVRPERRQGGVMLFNMLPKSGRYSGNFTPLACFV